MASWMRAYDPTRLIHYESGRPGPEIADVYSCMYPDLEQIRRLLADGSERRPIMMCEYAYAKGNSTGNFFKFWDMVDAYPRFQGGCVWDWHDKALLHTTADGRPYYAYGGDLGDDFDYARFYQENEDPQMCCNGIVGPDLSPIPARLKSRRSRRRWGSMCRGGRALPRGKMSIGARSPSGTSISFSILRTWRSTGNWSRTAGSSRRACSRPPICPRAHAWRW